MPGRWGGFGTGRPGASVSFAPRNAGGGALL